MVHIQMNNNSILFFVAKNEPRFILVFNYVFKRNNQKWKKINVVFHFNQTHLLFLLIALIWGQLSSKSDEAQCNSRYTCKLWTCRLIYFYDQDNKITSQHLNTVSDIFGIKQYTEKARITIPYLSVYCITHASYNSINIDHF